MKTLVKVFWAEFFANGQLRKFGERVGDENEIFWKTKESFGGQVMHSDRKKAIAIIKRRASQMKEKR